MTIQEVHEGDDIDDEVQPAYFCSVPVKCLLDAVSDCSGWVITISTACIILSPIILSETPDNESDNTSAYAALGLFAMGMFGCTTGIACKIASCYVEDEEDMSEPTMVGMV